MCSFFQQEVDCRTPHSLTEKHRRRLCMIALLCAICILQSANEARAQCTARDVLQNQLKLKKPAQPVPDVEIRSAADVPVWKTIAIGTFPNSLALRNALDSIGCNPGTLAAEILARPAFIVSSGKRSVELVAASAVQLGFKTDTVALAAIYERAKQLGFGLAAAEVGPQLRLQYLDQPVGEFLMIGMEPIKTWAGEQVILTVANGGAGLVLIGQDVRYNSDIPATSRLIFVQADQAGPAGILENAAASPPF
jgi:hypothetical protein